MPDYLKLAITLLVLLAFGLGLAAGLLGTWPDDRATIGGTRVPALTCEEDEVITWTGIDTLGCVHYEEIN